MRLKTLLSFCFVACYLRLAKGQRDAPPPPGGYYTTRYDHIDIERILNQKRLVHYYTECLMERGPCTPQGVEFKRILPEALKTNCLRCTEKQRFVTLKSIRRLKKEYPAVWAELSTIWDPSGEYVQRLEESLKQKPSQTPEIQQSPTVVNKASSDRVRDVSTPAPKPSEQVPVFTRIGSDPSINNVQNVQIQIPISEVLPSPKPQVQPVQTTANTIANKPISFSSTTAQPVVIISTTKPTSTLSFAASTASPVYLPNNLNTIKMTTKKMFTTILQDRTPVTTNRISYNYDFSATVKPLHQIPANGINMVIKGVNTIIQPISDIAGRVISAGTDIAGIVLNALGVRRTY